MEVNTTKPNLIENAVLECFKENYPSAFDAKRYFVVDREVSIGGFATDVAVSEAPLDDTREDKSCPNMFLLEDGDYVGDVYVTHFESGEVNWIEMALYEKVISELTGELAIVWRA
ncbi:MULTISPECIES: hypothetical protein [Rhodobacterales]|uniref:hypothetical protein n=1 Tax=Rhodobacterales TaxID=204455 RepID=UPI00329A3656